MTDSEFSLFQTITAIILTLINAGCLTALYYPFIPNHKFHRANKMIRCTLVYAVYGVISAVGILVPGLDILGMLGVILILGLLAPVLQINKYFSVFLTITYFCFDCSIRLIGNSMLYLLNTRFAYGEQLEIALRNTAYHYTSVYVIDIVLNVMLIFLVSRKILKANLELSFRELSYLCIVPIIGIVFGKIVDRLLFVVKDHVTFSIYADYPAFLVLIPLIAILFCIGIFVSLISYQEMMKLQEEQNRFFLEEQQVRAMQERINEVEQFYNGIRKIRHEMRNHLTNIKGLVKNEKYADIEQYISKMDESMDLFELSVKTGNPILDVIVNDKKNLAEKSGIDFEADFSFPASEGFDAYDIGIIVNNLLTNAIEACERIQGSDKYIYLSGRQKKKFYMIEVINSCEEAANLNQNNGLPISTKENTASLHGIGLTNVKETALKYMGDIDINAGQSEFCITVLLQEINIKTER